MQQPFETTSLVNLKISLAATPEITLTKVTGGVQADVSMSNKSGNFFTIYMEATLPYEKLSPVLGSVLKGKRLELTEGFFSQHLILQSCKVYSDLRDRLVAEVPFSGSYTGILYLTGLPYYNAATRHVELQDVAYDLKTDSLVLKGAKWLFGNLILDEIKKYTVVDITAFYKTIHLHLTKLLNKEWTKGIQANGDVSELAVTGVAAQRHQLVMNLRCTGNLSIAIAAQEFKL